MKKLIIFSILFLGIGLRYHQHSLSLSMAQTAYADDWGDEDEGGGDSGDVCDPSSESYDPFLCDEGGGDSGDVCDPSSMYYDPTICDGGGGDSGDVCDPTSASYDYFLCNEGGGGDSGDVCDPTSASYNETLCASSGDQCDESSPNYNPSACEGATCDPGSPNYNESECQAQSCDESSANYDPSQCETSTCDPGNVNYDESECQAQSCDDSSVNYDPSQCEYDTCDPSNVNYDESACQAQSCDDTSVNYDPSQCEYDTCDPSNVNYNEAECQAQVCDDTSVNFDASACENATCDPNNVNYNEAECQAQACDSTSVNYDPSQCQNCTVSLTLSSSTGKLGDLAPVTLTASGGTNGTNYKFQAYFGGEWEDLQDGSGNTFNWTVNVIGTVQFRVVATCGSSEVNSSAVNFTSSWCVTDFKTQFSSQMNAAWTAMLNDTENTGSSNPTIYERGFVGEWDGGTFNSISKQSSAACSTGKVEIDLSDYVQTGGSVSGGKAYIVGNFHTHYSLKYCVGTDCINPGPSTPDKNAAATPYPRIVRTSASQVCDGDDVSVLSTTDTAFGAMTGCRTSDY